MVRSGNYLVWRGRENMVSVSKITTVKRDGRQEQLPRKVK